MTLEERMLNGKLYDCADEKLQAQQRALNELVFDYNNTRPSDSQRRQELLRQIFQDMGEGCYIEPPLHANWGSHTHLGNHVYANFNLTLVDDTHVYIGDNVMFGPNVTITAAGHPVDPDLRRQVYQYNFPVRIEENVWVGAGVIILPGAVSYTHLRGGAAQLYRRRRPGAGQAGRHGERGLHCGPGHGHGAGLLHHGPTGGKTHRHAGQAHWRDFEN